MPNFAENFGLDFFFEEENLAMGFMAYLTREGRAINGYYECPTLFNPMGDVDLFVKTQKVEDGKLEVVGLDTHCCGINIWSLRNMGIDLTPEGALLTERVFMFNNQMNGEGMIPVHLINADVLPSFMEGDIVEMQLSALPLEINYYADEDEYANSMPADKEGCRLLVAEGSLLAIDFLVNHSVKDVGGDPSGQTDDRVTFRAKVKKLFHGMFEMDELKDHRFVICIADTQFGELCFVHTIDQIAEDQRKNIRVGAVISGVCILSGDVAVCGYENGFIRDYEHNLKLIKQTIVHGEAERIRPVLHENAVYISEVTGKTYNGVDEIVDRLNTVHNNQIKGGNRTFAYSATITQVEEEMKHSVGERCIVLAYDEEENYEAILFLDVDEDGYIVEMYISQDSRYHFAMD